MTRDDDKFIQQGGKKQPGQPHQDTRSRRPDEEQGGLKEEEQGALRKKPDQQRQNPDVND